MESLDQMDCARGNRTLTRWSSSLVPLLVLSGALSFLLVKLWAFLLLVVANGCERWRVDRLHHDDCAFSDLFACLQKRIESGDGKLSDLDLSVILIGFGFVSMNEWRMIGKNLTKIRKWLSNLLFAGLEQFIYYCSTPKCSPPFLLFLSNS